MTFQAQWLTTIEAARYLRVSRTTLYNYARAGRIKPHVYGPDPRQKRYSSVELDAFITGEAL